MIVVLEFIGQLFSSPTIDSENDSDDNDTDAYNAFAEQQQCKQMYHQGQRQSLSTTSGHASKAYEGRDCDSDSDSDSEDDASSSDSENDESHHHPVPLSVSGDSHVDEHSFLIGNDASPTSTRKRHPNTTRQSNSNSNTHTHSHSRNHGEKKPPPPSIVKKTTVWSGDPGNSAGHVATHVSSYFSRLWKNGNKGRVWYIYLRKLVSS